MKKTIRLTEQDLHNLIREAISEIRKKKEPKVGTIEWGDKRVEATEDGVDKYGNPMYRVKNAPSKAGRKTKDGSRRVQAFDFIPYSKNNVNEQGLHKLIRETDNNWSNMEPVDKFHPDYSYFNQEIDPMGKDGFDNTDFMYPQYQALVISDNDSDVSVEKYFNDVKEAQSWAVELVHGQYLNSDKRVCLHVCKIESIETVDNFEETNQHEDKMNESITRAIRKVLN